MQLTTALVSQIDKLSVGARHHINVVHLKMAKPAHLPFHLLTWGQHYVRRHNCQQYFHQNATSAAAVSPGSDVGESKRRALRPHKGDKGAAAAAEVLDVDLALLPADDLYDICRPGGVARSIGAPVNVTYTKKHEGYNLFRSDNRTSSGAKSSGNSTAAHSHGNHNTSSTSSHSRAAQTPIKFVYFTECDQVVRFDSFETLRALSAASNESCFFTGRRREKNLDSAPDDYMGSLTSWRNCGVPGYSLHWPRDIHVKFE